MLQYLSQILFKSNLTSTVTITIKFFFFLDEYYYKVIYKLM
jgi:hypothetical protein